MRLRWEEGKKKRKGKKPNKTTRRSDPIPTAALAGE